MTLSRVLLLVVSFALFAGGEVGSALLVDVWLVLLVLLRPDPHAARRARRRR